MSWRPPIKAIEIYSNNFDTSVDMTEVESVDNPPTYSISSSKIVFSYDAGATKGGRVALGKTDKKLIASRIVVEAKLDNLGSHGFVGFGIHDGTNRLMVAYDAKQGRKKVELHTSSGDTDLGGINESISTPVYIRAVIQPIKIDVYESTDGQNWTHKFSVNISGIDLRDKAIIQAFYPSILAGYYIESGAGTETIEIDYVEWYYFGGYGARDPTPVTTKYGLLYKDGEGKYYLTVTLAGNGIENATAGIVKASNPDDPSTFQLVAIIFTDRDNKIVGDSPISLVIDNNIVHAYGSRWGTRDILGKVGIWYTQLDLSIFQEGVHICTPTKVLFDEGWDVVAVYNNNKWYFIHAIASGDQGGDIHILTATKPDATESEMIEIFRTSGGVSSNPYEGGKIILEKNVGLVALYQQSWVSLHKFYKYIISTGEVKSWEHGLSNVDSGHPCPSLTKIITHTNEEYNNLGWSHGSLIAVDPPDDFYAGSSLILFSITGYPSQVSGYPNEQKTISITVKNQGESDGSVELRIKDHNGNVVASQQQSIVAGSSYTFNITITLPSQTGTYTWKIEAYNVNMQLIDDSKSFTVEVGVVGVSDVFNQLIQLFMQLLPFIILLIIVLLLVAALK